MFEKCDHGLKERYEGEWKVRYGGMTPRERVELYDGIIQGRVSRKRVTDKMVADAEAYYDLRIKTMTVEMQEAWSDEQRDAHYKRNPADLMLPKEPSPKAKELNEKRKKQLREVLSILSNATEPITIDQIKKRAIVTLPNNVNIYIAQGWVVRSGWKKRYGKDRVGLYEITSCGQAILDKIREENS